MTSTTTIDLVEAWPRVLNAHDLIGRRAEVRDLRALLDRGERLISDAEFEDAITALAAELHAAEYRFLTLIAEPSGAAGGSSRA